MTRARNFDERCISEGCTHSLPLTSVNSMVSKRASVHTI